MAKGTVKKATGFFFCWMGLMAAVCVPSFMAGVAHTEPGGPVTVLNASAVGLDSDFISVSSTTGPERTGQVGQQQTAAAPDHL